MTCMSKNGGCNGVTPNARQAGSHPTTRTSIRMATAAPASPSAITVPEPILQTSRLGRMLPLFTVTILSVHDHRHQKPGDDLYHAARLSAVIFDSPSHCSNCS